MRPPNPKPQRPDDQRTKNSRAKGKRGELLFAKFLRNHKLSARRGQQFKGGSGSPDVVCDDLTGIHFEVKFIQGSKAPFEWLGQAVRDKAEGAIPIVAHKRNARDWIAIMRMEDVVDLLIEREIKFVIESERV